jgi:chemotaxis protein CheZ
MPVQRNLFRIEELSSRRERPAVSAEPADAALRHAETMTELRALRALLELREAGTPPRCASGFATETEAFSKELATVSEAVRRTKEEIARLVVIGFAGPEMGRVSQELNAVVSGTETATHRILQASEEIEENAKSLAAAIKTVHDQHLARDIVDQVTQIFEACNFQDLVGQRIGKVAATLLFIEEHILKLVAIWGGIEQFADGVETAEAERDKERKLVNAPKLSDARGYVSQNEIDEMFSRR